MQLIEINHQNKQKYQSFVQANGSFLQDWSWGDFKQNQGEKVHRFLIEEKSEAIFTAQIFENIFRSKKYFYIPYGPVVLRQSDLQRTMDFFCIELKKQNPNLVFVRFEPQFQNKIKGAAKSTDLNPHKTLILNLDKSDEQLSTEMKPKTRYNIKLAQKHGVEIKINQDLEQGVDLILHSSHRAGVHAFQKKYYLDLLDQFSDADKNISAKLYTAWYENKMIAANLMLYYKSSDSQKNRAIYLFGGSSDEHRNIMAPYLLHWQAIQDARKNNFKTYDFWGIEEDPKHPWHGFSKFKLGFGGEVIEYGGTQDYVLNRTWYNIYKVFRKLNRLRKNATNR